MPAHMHQRHPLTGCRPRVMRTLKVDGQIADLIFGVGGDGKRREVVMTAC